MAFLYRMNADGTLTQCWEIPGGPLLVGRGDFAGASIPDSSLSRSHFLILRESGEYFVVDLESQNGTWLDGERVTGRRLHQGDILKAGQSYFMFSSHRIPFEGAPVPARFPIMMPALVPQQQATAATAA